MEEIGNIEVALKDVSDSIVKLQSLHEDEISQLSSIESAKLNVSLAYTLCSLLFINENLKSDGSKKDKIMKELQRIQASMEKLKHIDDKENDTNDRKRLRLDPVAATRIIQFELLNANKSK